MNVIFYRKVWAFLVGLLLLYGGNAQAGSIGKPVPQMSAAQEQHAQAFRVLCYHDIRDSLRESFDKLPDSTAISTFDLVQHFTWLRENGYSPVSLQQILDARAGRGNLPDKAVLLTFDDGYKSVYTRVFPLLKLFRYPAVIALVGEWMDTPKDGEVDYGEQRLPRDYFVSWDEVREMTASGLVEVASHSHAMHKGIQANPQGNTLPAATTRMFDSATGGYETDERYAARVKDDLQHSAKRIAAELHRAPRAVVWPYGAYNMSTAKWASEIGMTVSLTLETGPNLPGDSLQQVRRVLVTYRDTLADLEAQLEEPSASGQRSQSRQRVMHVDLDYVYDPDPVVEERNLSQLVERVHRLHPSAVFLQAFADPDGDGVAQALYFPNRHLPVRRDLFSRVAWQLRTRAGARVYAWMPVLAFSPPDSDVAARRLVLTDPNAPDTAKQGRYQRLSPFDPIARRVIAEIYDDLGKHASFEGIVFHDDATLSDFEDASEAALGVYKEWGLPPSVPAIRADAQLRRRWAEKKTAYLNAFTRELAQILRQHHPDLLTARNMYAEPVRNPDAMEWFAQDLRSFVATYDYVALMAMPFMEGATNQEQWLRELVERVRAEPGAIDKTIFEVQSRDWKTGRHVEASTLVRQWQLMRLSGALHWGYYPDDFLNNHPAEDMIRPVISGETFPHAR